METSSNSGRRSSETAQPNRTWMREKSDECNGISLRNSVLFQQSFITIKLPPVKWKLLPLDSASFLFPRKEKEALIYDEITGLGANDWETFLNFFPVKGRVFLVGRYPPPPPESMPWLASEMTFPFNNDGRWKEKWILWSAGRRSEINFPLFRGKTLSAAEKAIVSGGGGFIWWLIRPNRPCRRASPGTSRTVPCTESSLVRPPTRSGPGAKSIVARRWRPPRDPER